jgi:Asp-tRNA(Asn)/Glu-tRNA(Gln) amidotransferase A subunit family amidase
MSIRPHISKGSAGLRTIFILNLVALLIIGGAFAFFSLKNRKKITVRDLKAYEKIIGLDFSSQERKMIVERIERSLPGYQRLRTIDIPNSLAPALVFNPLIPGMSFKSELLPFRYSADENLRAPSNPEELAFLPVTALAQLIRTRQITSTQLTRLYLDRLKKYGFRLECIITLTEDLALAQAKRADEEIASGLYRGPLHGIPWGAKDLLSTKGIRTTWGAEPYKDQIFDKDATVVRRLEEAGAVLVAKLTLGALAMGDVWYGGQTKNPWNLEQGSSGSSAGPAAAAAAGLVGFAIGTETRGSIVSPSARCGASGLRPTFGRVSRNGAMALSWSMDKIGPICRSAEDCALVLNAIYGPDGQDLSVVDYPFNWDPDMDLGQIRVGYLKASFERESKGRRDAGQEENNKKTLEILESLGLQLVPFELPDFPVNTLNFILSTESAAAFDELTRSNRDDLLVRQSSGSWPNTFRQARFVPAVEYIQANRARILLMQKMAEQMKEIDVVVTPTGTMTSLTNLTGHPAVIVPNGFRENGTPTSITFIGNLFAESKTLRLAKAFQDATDFHLKHPNLDKKVEPDIKE